MSSETDFSIFTDGVSSFFDIVPYRDIISWAQENIDFSGDTSTELQRLDLSLSPHLVEPLKTWEFSGRIREVTVVGIQQHGKTLLEVIGVLYNMVFNPCSMICVYPSDDLAEDVNKTKYEPLIRKIPALAQQLARPNARRKDRYVLDAATMFFQGAGIEVMTKSCKIMIADETDRFPVIRNMDNMSRIRNRGRSYSESIYYKSSSPTTEDGPIWKEFLKGSQGYWTLRCLKCGKLTMRSCDFLNFQFESTYSEEQKSYVATPGTERLICPKCGHEHVESDRAAMNRDGAYVHRFPERVDLLPSFQFGALCSQLPSMSWGRIANTILECGKRADIKAHYELDNSFKGLPYKERDVSQEDIENLKVHFYHVPPSPEELEMVFVVSDTQDTFSPTGVFALDSMDNLWLLSYANIPYLWLSQAEREEIERREGHSVETVEDVVLKPYRGILPLFHVVDYRGHRQREIMTYAMSRRNVIMYAGTATRTTVTWKPSAKNQRMILVDAKAFQRVLIWQLYKQKNKQMNYLWLPDTLPRETQAEITCVQPSNKSKVGHLFENWEPEHDAVHDAFDVLKMAYFAVDFAIASFRRERFRLGKSPALLRRWRAADERRVKRNEE